jgi:hypothetical protein
MEIRCSTKPVSVRTLKILATCSIGRQEQRAIFLTVCAPFAIAFRMAMYYRKNQVSYASC